jgi:hypothetical protein
MILLIVTIGLSGTQLDQDSAVGGELPGRHRWRLVLLHTRADRWHLPTFRALLFRASLVAGVGAGPVGPFRWFPCGLATAATLQTLLPIENC